MPQLIVRDTEGKDILTRPLADDDVQHYYDARWYGELVTFADKRYKLHSVAKTKPGADCILCVSFDSWEPSYCDC